MKAEFIPHVNLDDIEVNSERAVAHALMNTLTPPWIIIHSFPWLHATTNYLEEGECDFILLHPEFGLLVVEVKGGAVGYDAQSGRWTTNGKPLKRSPFEQARTNMHRVVDGIRKRHPTLPPFTFGYAVVLPDCDLNGNPPPGCDPRILAGHSEMPKLGTALLNALKNWGKKPKLSAPQFKELRTALISDCKLVYALHAELTANERVLVRLTDQQLTVLNGLEQNRRVMVEGPAGTGKTLMALRRAEEFAKKGLKTLLLCFNSNLMADLARRLDGSSVKVSTFLALCRELSLKAELPLGPYWHTEAADCMLQALRYRAVSYDAVIVDEAQDFEPTWWPAVERLLRREDSYLYIFYDNRQNLYGRENRFPQCSVTYNLMLNCRNTRSIANVCGQIIDFEMQTSPFAPSGHAAKIVPFSNHEEARKKAAAVISDYAETLRIPLGRIACLSPYSREKSLLGNNAVANFSTTDSLEKWRRNEALWLSSIRGFKGLEADALLITDLSEYQPGFFDKADFYVACSRAKHRLAILTNSLKLPCLRSFRLKPHST